MTARSNQPTDAKYQSLWKPQFDMKKKLTRTPTIWYTTLSNHLVFRKSQKMQNGDTGSTFPLIVSKFDASSVNYMIC